MSLRTKLTVGLAFLFLIIFGLAIYSSFDIKRLSGDAERILKDNYDSLVYCKNMLVALDDMRTNVASRVLNERTNQPSAYDSQVFEAGRATFESNLNAEKGNITEIHEEEYVKELESSYTSFIGLSLQVNNIQARSSTFQNDYGKAYLNVRQAILKINDLNMEAIERKSQSAGNDARKMTTAMAAVGAACIILAFFYFWYFPFFVSNSLTYLASKMKELLKNVGLKIDTQTKDEAFVLLHSIDLLENKLVKKTKKE